MNHNSAFTIPIKVRFRDLDALGHVNNAVYFTYFEEGRRSFFHALEQNADPYDFRFILAHVCCDYIRQVRLVDRLALHMEVGNVGEKSFAINYELTDRIDPSNIFAKGESVLVGFDYTRNRSVPLSAALRKKLIEYRRK